MQRLQTVFQLSMVALLCLSATIFAAAEEQPLVSLTLPAAIISWAVVDRRQGKGLGPGWSFALGLLGVAAAGIEFATGGIEARILAPSHLLAYLVWIVLFQHKENRHYWILLGLTVLQVAIASLLTNSSWLGFAVILYASWALWTMGVFTLQRSVQRIGASTSESNDRRVPEPGGRAMQASIMQRDSTVQNSVHLDAGERLIGWHFTGGAAVMTVLSLALSGLFFLFIPRIWPNQYQWFNDSPIAGARPLTGFTEDVRLGDMGQILENDELVMEITLLDADTKQPIPTEDYDQQFGSADPLFRGQVMELYADSRWQRAFHDGGNGRGQIWPPDVLEGDNLQQHVRLQPIGSAILFAAGRLLTCKVSEGKEDLVRDPNSGTFRRENEADVSRPFEYDAFTSRRDPLYKGINPDYRRACMQWPSRLERLRELVQTIAPDDDKNTDLERAERLVSYLRDNQDFSYSLDLSVQDPEIDPIEDFLFNRKRGHCEYYASTLALMLRAANIPSRVVSGFKGGQLNETTHQYEVRQLHAHLWVEAYVDSYAWVPLDATPGARDEKVAQLQAAPTSVFSKWRDSWERMWSQGVRLSRADQDKLLYEPIRNGAVGVWDAVRDLRGTSSRLRELLRALGTSPERWISWRGGVAVFVLLLIGTALYSLFRRLLGLLQRIRGATQADTRQAPIVAFYERYRRAAARAGYERASAQTPREFAGTVTERLRSLGAPLVPAPIPQFITENYYRVRFGNEELAVEQLETLQRQLDELERQFNERPQGNGRRPV